MSESEANRDGEVDERLGETISYSQGLNFNSHNTPIHMTGVYPYWQANSSTQVHQESPQLDNNHAYPNMTFFQQPFPMPPYNNVFYQQHAQPPHHQTTQPQVDVNAFQHNTPPPPPPSKANRRNATNWTTEQDKQLTIAWLRVSTDPVVGVGQKNNTLWERVSRLFDKLMYDRHNLKPEDCVRTSNGVESRMNKIKSQCSKWTAIRARVLGSYKSGWSPEDIEKLCLENYKTETKKNFKWKECWEILKENPKWHDYINTKSGSNNQSNAGTRTRKAKRPPPSSEPQLGAQTDESVPNNTHDALENQTPYTPATSSVCSEPDVRENGRVDCTPNLDGPASIEIQRPPGTTISKPKNQRQRRLKQHSEAIASASQSLNDSLKNLQSASTCQWEKLAEDNQRRDLVDNERYDDMKRKHDIEHDLKVENELSDLVQKRIAIGEKLCAAIQLLDQMDPNTLVTNNQRRLYEIRKNAVNNLEDRYEDVNSPPSVVPNEIDESVGTNQRRRLNADDVHIGLDSPR